MCGWPLEISVDAELNFLAPIKFIIAVNNIKMKNIIKDNNYAYMCPNEDLGIVKKEMKRFVS